jgi:hypothetical protein
MTPETRIIDDSFRYGFRKRRSTKEQIERNEREKEVQRERDKRARNEAETSGKPPSKSN